MVQVTTTSGSSVHIDDQLYAFVRDEVLAGTDKTVDEIFGTLAELITEFEPKNRELLTRRTEHQTKIDSYYQEKRDGGWSPSPESAEQDAQELEKFLESIGYISPQQTIDLQMLSLIHI